MVGGCGAGTAAQHELVAHELAVVFSDSSGRGPKTRVRGVGTLGPLPNVAEQLSRLIAAGGGRTRVELPRVEQIPLHRSTGGRGFPLGFGRQPQVAPAGLGIRLEIADMGNRLILGELF